MISDQTATSPAPRLGVVAAGLAGIFFANSTITTPVRPDYGWRFSSEAPDHALTGYPTVLLVPSFSDEDTSLDYSHFDRLARSAVSIHTPPHEPTFSPALLSGLDGDYLNEYPGE